MDSLDEAVNVRLCPRRPTVTPKQDSYYCLDLSQYTAHFLGIQPEMAVSEEPTNVLFEGTTNETVISFSSTVPSSPLPDS